MSRLKIGVRHIDKLSVVSLDGRASLAMAPLLRKTLNAELDRSPRGILVDASGLDEIVGACFHEILMASRQLKVRNGALVIFSLNERVTGSLRQAKLLHDLALHPDLNSARQSVETMIVRARCAAATSKILAKHGGVRAAGRRPLRHRAGNRLADLVERVLVQ